MNNNFRVLHFVVIAFAIYFAISFCGTLIGFKNIPFKRTNLIADLFIDTSKTPNNIPQQSQDTTAALAFADKPFYNFNLYNQPAFITNFKADTNACTLPHFIQKLKQLKATGKGKIRVGYFGDSMIECDLMTQDFRKLLQAYFGGQGVGFVPLQTPTSNLRSTANTSITGDWLIDNFKTEGNTKLYLSGYSYTTNNGSFSIKDNTILPNNMALQKALICGATQGYANIVANGQPINILPKNKVNRIVLKTDNTTSLAVQINNNNLPIYGASFETEDGVFVDNFSFRGISGIELSSIDPGFIKAIAENNNYDLIIFQYGVNVLFRPNDKNFNWYAKLLMPVIKKFRKNFSDADFIVVSSADRAFNYNGQYASAVGIDSLIKLQATMAYETQSSFYNQYATMGGKNAIVNWATHSPAWANKDYVHPNAAGCKILASTFFNAIMQQYKNDTTSFTHH